MKSASASFGGIARNDVAGFAVKVGQKNQLLNRYYAPEQQSCADASRPDFINTIGTHLPYGAQPDDVRS